MTIDDKEIDNLAARFVLGLLQLDCILKSETGLAHKCFISGFKAAQKIYEEKLEEAENIIKILDEGISNMAVGICKINLDKSVLVEVDLKEEQPK